MQAIQEAIDELFDLAYVLGLPSSIDRRAHVKYSFAAIGLTRFRFVNAYAADSKEVAHAFESGLVKSYPDCFRCGKLRCEHDDCNNVLIAPQVANFLSYLELWRGIAKTPQRALVLEDDVVFHKHAVQTLGNLSHAIKTGTLTFKPETPRLLRLGWALSKDHVDGGSFRIERTLRMSNPCHALTSAYARALLDRFVKINTTSDVFLHSMAPQPEEAVTVFPPIASEMSWSSGAAESLIHPKSIRSTYLRERGMEKEARANDEKVRNHIKHIYYRPFLIIGHPCAGQHDMLQFLSRLGLDIGRERDGYDGISTWVFAVGVENPNGCDGILRTRKALFWDHLLHPVSEPTRAVPQIMRHIQEHPDLHEFRRNQILAETGEDLGSYASTFEQAELPLVLWSAMIDRMNPNLTFRVEDGAAELVAYLSQLEHGKYVKAAEHVSSEDIVDDSAVVASARLSTSKYADWDRLSPSTWRRIEAYCRHYGYSLPTMKRPPHHDAVKCQKSRS